MNRPSPLAIFTPSLVDPEILQTLFVGDSRTRILNDLVARATSAATSSSRAHRMIVGPRGSGKTHLVTLAAHHIGADVPGVQLAWLPEDPWTIESYADLLQAIEVALDNDRAGKTPALRNGADIASAEARLREAAAEGGPIVVLVENFDQVLEVIGHAGQAQLRAFLENDRALLLLVTATRLGQSMLAQTAPFYGFFSTVDLAPLTVDEATEMLRRIAAYRGDEALADVLTRNPGGTVRHRLLAVDALAGGQPRVWAMLAVALTVEGLSDLASLLMQRFDDLVPYYQEQLGRLSPRERKVVKVFADANCAINVKQAAGASAADEKSTAKTLTQLRRSGWIQEVHTAFDHLVDARRTYYELAEPLARLAFQIKDNRRTPLPILVSFLSAWFSSRDLDDRALPASGRSQAISALLIASREDHARPFEFATALSGEAIPSTVHEPLLLLVDDALFATSCDDAEQYFALPSGVRRMVDDSVASLGMEATWIRVTRSAPLLRAWVARTERMARQIQGEHQRSAALLHADALRRAGRYAEAIALGEQVLADQVRVLGTDHPDTLNSRHNLASSYWSAGRTTEAITLEEHVLDDRVRVLGPDHPNTLTTSHNLANSYESAGRTTEAIALQERVVADHLRVLGADHPNTLTTRSTLANSYESAGRTTEAIALQELVLSDRMRLLGTDHPSTLTTRSNLAHSYWSAGRTTEAIALQEQVLADCVRVLGDEDPDTLTARGNLANSYESAGRTTEAIALQEQVLADSVRVLGADHPSTLTTSNNLAYSYWSAGRTTEAIALQEQVLADSVRVLGANHPDAVDTCGNLAAMRSEHQPERIPSSGRER